MLEGKLAEIREWTDKDTTLQEVLRFVRSGWPQGKREVSEQVKPYCAISDELTVYEGILFRRDRVVIPAEMRAETIQRKHGSHLGVNGCLRRARECVYWPGMAARVREFVSQCEICRSMDMKQQKEPLQPHSVPSRPWVKLGADLFELDGQSFLVIVDYHSGFVELDVLSKTTSGAVIRMLKAQFARHGIPELLITDNGPQFASAKFQDFARQWDFEHRTSSPAYPQSNGRAENAVKTVKRLIKCAKRAGSDPWLAILDYRNTPTESLGSSPARRLFSRRTRTLVPTAASLLKPSLVDDDPRRLADVKAQQSKRYNRTAKALPVLQKGDAVRIEPTRGSDVWRKGVIKAQLPNRSYDVQTEAGTTIRRTRRHLRQSKEVFPPPLGPTHCDDDNDNDQPRRHTHGTLRDSNGHQPGSSASPTRHQLHREPPVRAPHHQWSTGRQLSPIHLPLWHHRFRWPCPPVPVGR